MGFLGEKKVSGSMLNNIFCWGFGGVMLCVDENLYIYIHKYIKVNIDV